MEKEERMKALRFQMEDIKEQLRALGTEEADSAKGHIKDYVDKASSALKDYVDGSSASLKEKMARAGEGTRRVGEKADGYAHENPWHVAALGLAVGLALGSLFSRDRR